MKLRLMLLSLCAIWLAAARAQEPFIPRTFTDPITNTAYRLERYLLANFPVGMVFLPDGTLLYTEKTTGSVRLVRPDGRLQAEPVITLPTSALQERGMLGIAVDPAFEQNQYVYIVHTREGTARATSPPISWCAFAWWMAAASTHRCWPATPSRTAR